MPDHVHLVVCGVTEDANFKAFSAKAKQYSGYLHSQKFQRRLWQRSFYEHVIRDGEDLDALICYVLMNPVRAALCQVPREYLHSGSEIYSWEQLSEFFRKYDARSG